MDCPKCIKEQLGATSGEPGVGRVSPTDLLRAALTAIDRGEAVAVRALLCRALAFDEPEAGG